MLQYNHLLRALRLFGTALNQSEVALPTRQSRRADYPFRTMAVGAQFSAPASECSNVRNTKREVQQATGRTFKTRMVGCDIRVRRTA